MKKEMIKLAGVFGIFVFLISAVSAFAVSSKYWEENPLTISPGETIETYLVLQNLAGESDLTVEATITEGNEFASLIGDSNIFIVPLGQKIEVPFSVSIPEDAVIGDSKNIIFSFRTLSNPESGEFGFGSGVEREIPLLIITEQKSTSPFSWWVYLVIVLAGILLIFGIIELFKKEKKKKK
ncbi:MAG: hypothetical protein WC812_00015 [Candidatus Pacearchaeota archaeon]|jgi:hypothetical protein